MNEVDRAYNVRAGVGEEIFQRSLARYRAESERATEGLAGSPGVVYDEASGERLDVWGTADGELRPVFVYLHGGYWRALSRHDSAFMAGMLAQRGIATVAVDYTLVPDADLEEIVRQCRAAVAWVHREGAGYGLDPRRIVVGGSSAGGHLTAMTMLDGWQEELGIPADVVSAALPISGIFDLRPLVGSFVNEWMGLDLRRAGALSPGSALPGRRMPVVVAVAEHDGSGFLAQSRHFHAAWGEPAELLIVPDRHHYDVVFDLMNPATQIAQALLRLFP